MNTTKNIRATVALAGLAIGLAAAPASAQATFNWLGLGDGQSFSDPANWSPVGLPGLLDEAKFDIAGSGTITFAVSPSNATLSVENDTVQFDLGAQTYTAAEMIIGDRLTDVGNLTVNGGHIETTTGLARIGRLSPATGSLVLTGGATMTNQRDLIVGDGGNGFFQIDAGCSAGSLIAFIADEIASTGDALIRGTWTITNSALIGNGGDGSMTVEAGGTVNIGFETKIGDGDFSSGSLTIDGAGSTVSSFATTTVGNFGPGTLTVSNGGLLTTAQLKIGDDAPGDVLVDGGTIIDTVGTGVGNRSTGTLTLANGGTVQSPLVSVIAFMGTLGGSGTIDGSVSNDEVVSPGNGIGTLTVTGDYTQGFGILNIELGGPVAGAGYDQLVVNGNSTLGGILNVSLVNGFSPANGQFVILQGGTVSGVFQTVNLPLGFSIAYEPDRVVVSIGSPCVADINGDGVLDLTDITAFISAFIAQDPAADLAPPAGVYDLADLSTFVQAFLAGCP